AEHAVRAAQLRPRVRRDPPCTGRQQDEGPHEDQSGDQHAALQPDALAQLVHHGQPLEPRTATAPVPRRRNSGAHARDLRRSHQYLTLGSTRTAIMSTRKFVTATTTAITTTIPCTATKSRACRYCASWKPSPRHSNVVSVRTAPTSSMAICMPATVMIGMRAGRQA